MSEEISVTKTPIKSMTLWGIIVAWLGIKLQASLAPYAISPEAIKGITDILTEGGMLMAVIGRAIATKKLQV
jgi:hypothetical protein